MTNNTRRHVAIALFGLALVGSLTPSYLHVAAFMGPVMPPELVEAMYVAALALDVLIIACSYAIIVTPAGRDRLWSHVGLWVAVAASVYANARYAVSHALWGPDVLISALLPVLAVIATHGLAAVLRAIPADAPAADPAPTAREIAPGEYALTPLPAPAPAKRKVPAAPKSVTSSADWHADALALLADGLSGAETARRVGVDAAQVSRLRRATVNGSGAP